jgi:predicted phage tail protein
MPTFSGESGLDPQSNYSFSGVQNVSRSGVPVNLIFGEIFSGSVIVSAGIDTVQVKGTA